MTASMTEVAIAADDGDDESCDPDHDDDNDLNDYSDVDHPCDCQDDDEDEYDDCKDEDHLYDCWDDQGPPRMASDQFLPRQPSDTRHLRDCPHHHHHQHRPHQKYLVLAEFLLSRIGGYHPHPLTTIILPKKS